MLSAKPIHHFEPITEAVYQAGIEHRSCVPGVVLSVDSPQGSTCTVQPAIREWIIDTDGTRIPVQIAPLVSVPIATFGVAGFALTFPVAAGDECLLLVADCCIDAVWQNGGSDSIQMDKRRHDLCDSIALPVRWTKPSVLANTSTNSAQLRSADGSTVIDLAAGQITLTAGAIKMGASGGTPQTLATNALVEWVNSTLLPALASHGITVTAPPANSVTTATEAS